MHFLLKIREFFVSQKKNKTDFLALKSGISWFKDLLPISERVSISWPVTEQFLEHTVAPFISYWPSGRIEDVSLSAQVVGVDTTYGFPRTCDQTPAVRIFPVDIYGLTPESAENKTIHLKAKCFEATITVTKHVERCPWCPDPRFQSVSAPPRLKAGIEFRIQGRVIATMSECLHDVVFKDMCADCGKDLREKGGRAGQWKEQATANVSMIHHVPELIVSESLAKKIGSADETNLITTRKLVLLVDLDQTIIHTSDKLMSADAEKHKDITKYNLHSRVYTTKLRPHTTEFLNKMSAMYEMHIVTFGERKYALRIAKILDPDARLFGQRILSRNELSSAQHKTENKALFPCGDNLVVIIDDRADVWQYSEALIQIKPYRFFKEVGDINAPKHSKEQMPVQIEDDAHEDRVLEEIERVLTNIHNKYYEKHDLKDADQALLDVKEVIKEERHKVLDGCVIVFSGIVSAGEKLERTEIYHLCLQFGATIVPEVVEEVTHVVGARYGTEKVHQAHRLGKNVVTVQWVYACVEKWMKADEKQFELTKKSTPPVGRPLGSKYVNNLSNMDTIGEAALADMNNEVDEALSDEDEDEGDNDDDEDDDGPENREDDKVQRDKRDKIADKEKIYQEDEKEKKNASGRNEQPESSDAQGKGQKRKHCPEMDDGEEESDSKDDDDEAPMSYKALLSRSRKEGRIVPESDKDEKQFELTKESTPPVGRPLGSKYVNNLSNMDEESEEMAALIERQIDEAADKKDDNDME
ncbi:hypothetical protein CRE_07009 [Caenorhabditis remanei]|uniref:RNA polymerase II subunit A C-terminal domain phosphatase n=1 Tax=Caenorhabditis remanei TaxID=31234 RepID=E3NB26_CAERE|nr:hypothetical protein CRE_07009 [Caenorhabditis remanei]